MKELTKKASLKQLKRIALEIKLHRTLTHPNIIKFEDFLETNDKIFLFLEYAQNGDLFDFIQ